MKTGTYQGLGYLYRKLILVETLHKAQRYSAHRTLPSNAAMGTRGQNIFRTQEGHVRF